jgi:hypothetical protein
MKASALKTETTAPAPLAQVMEQTNQKPSFTIPELKPPEQAGQDTGFTMPELKTPEQAGQDTGFTIPELKTPEQTSQNTGFTMPELKPPEQVSQNTGFTMPELKPPEQVSQNTGFTMPNFNSSVESPQVEIAPVIPDFKLPEEMPSFNPESESTADSAFKLPELQQSANSEGMPLFMSDKAGTMQEMQNIPGQAPVSPPATKQDDTKPDKLEGNILMYMPRGAKVKKEIIKSLVSRQFSQEDIDRKIQELVTREVLVLKQENGIEQLHRLK